MGATPADPYFDLAAVEALLIRERAILSDDERLRLDRRLQVWFRSLRPSRPASRVAVVVCVALGILLMTAGTGLAITGFTASPAVRSPAVSARGAPGRTHPTSLGQIPSSAGTSSAAGRLRAAEGHSDLPFSGFGALPILAAGVGLLATGGILDGRLRRREALAP
jgi:hypothetical protein